MSKHGNTERYIIELFNNNKQFNFEDRKYEILKIGKPRPSKGECKTDIYILAADIITNAKREIKISIKQSDADFLENKISLSRAKEIFGDDTDAVLKKSILSVKDSFLEDYLIYFNGYKRTKSKCIKIGWKFEFVNKHGGKRSGIIQLTEAQKIDIYSGSNLNIEKRNAKVIGDVINESGIANYILVVSKYEENLDYYLSELIPINKFAKDKSIYFACKAINYICEGDKWDSNRPLSVYINWFMHNEKLKAEFVFDTPLEIRANVVGLKIKSMLKDLKINSSNFHELEQYLHKDVNYYKSI
jgi:hypothetical protein